MYYTMFMVEFLLIALILLWFFGYIQIPWLNIPHVNLFVLNGKTVTLYELLILIVVVWAISFLPNPLKQIAGVLLILWLLATLGLVAIAGFSQIILIALIVGIGLSLVK